MKLICIHCGEKFEHNKDIPYYKNSALAKHQEEEMNRKKHYLGLTLMFEEYNPKSYWHNIKV